MIEKRDGHGSESGSPALLRQEVWKGGYRPRYVPANLNRSKPSLCVSWHLKTESLKVCVKDTAVTVSHCFHDQLPLSAPMEY